MLIIKSQQIFINGFRFACMFIFEFRIKFMIRAVVMEGRGISVFLTIKYLALYNTCFFILMAL